MKSFFKTFSILALLGICIVVYSCQTDDVSDLDTQQNITQQTKPNLSTVTMVNQGDIPDIVSSLKGKLSGNVALIGKKLVADNMTIDMEHIKQARKKGQHTNYTFAMRLKDTPIQEVYMLTIDKYANGQLGQPMVIKYTLSDKTLAYILDNDGTIDYKYFKASYDFYPLESFVSTKGLMKTSGCSGTLGSDPGEYPTTPPGGSFVHFAFSHTFNIGFSTSSNTGVYVYTSTVTDSNGEVNTVSTLGSSDVVTADVGLSGETADIPIPENTASVSQTTTTGSGAECNLVKNTNSDGLVSYTMVCPDVTGDNDKSSFTKSSVCQPIDYNALNITDLRELFLEFHLPALDHNWLEDNREFMTPLVNYWNNSGKDAAARNLAGKIIDAVAAGQLGEVQGMQMLHYMNVNNVSANTSNMVNRITDAILNNGMDQNTGIEILGFADQNGNSDEITSLITLSLEEYPDPASFNFQTVSDNWQACTVNNLRFKGRTLTLSEFGNTESTDYDIDFNNELLTFETWIRDRFTNELLPDTAAEIAAEAVNRAIWSTIKNFHDKWGFSELQIKNYFIDELKRIYSDMTNGGRVRRGNPFNLLSTEFLIK